MAAVCYNAKMALKIILLAAAAVAVFMLTRGRGENKRRRKAVETTMTRCPKCGVYHPADEKCACQNGETE